MAHSDLTARVAQLALACAVLGVGVALLLRAALGSDGYSTLVNGLALSTGLPFVVVNCLVGVVFVAIAWIKGRRPGIGTIVQPIVTGFAVSAVMAVVAEPQEMVARAAMLAGSFVLIALGVAGYLGSRTGAGPPRVRLGVVRGRRRRCTGSARWCRRRSGSPGRRARRGCTGSPRRGFCVARRRTRARKPAGMAGRPGPAAGLVQRRAMSVRCQRRIVDGVTSRPRRRRAGSSRARAAITARSVQLIRGRGMRRWSTASWWRRTRISISLVVSDLMLSAVQARSLENMRYISFNATGGSCRTPCGDEWAGQRR